MGKDEVSSSNLDKGSIKIRLAQEFHLPSSNLYGMSI
jgi:hypothetical protein